LRSNISLSPTLQLPPQAPRSIGVPYPEAAGLNDLAGVWSIGMAEVNTACCILAVHDDFEGEIAAGDSGGPCPRFRDPAYISPGVLGQSIGYPSFGIGNEDSVAVSQTVAP